MRDAAHNTHATQRVQDSTLDAPEPLATVPDLATEAERVAWIADLLVRGLWERGLAARCAERWGVKLQSAKNYAHIASLHVNLVTGDKTRLIALSKHRLNQLADNAQEDRDRIAANVGLLRATGTFGAGRGGGALSRDPDEDLAGDDEQRRAVEIVRHPGPNMVAVLREAFAVPGPALRELLDEYTRTIEVTE